ncbi:MAG: hypothetical protein KDJ77_12370 [Rhodobiaceae bacterium]|nr:hypothetical protein [Rhodobiaceae bacterium]
MKTILVIQHVEAEYLGLMEDHLESRSVRFQYCRPFVPGASLPESPEGYDGLVLLGAGPLGVVSGSLIPSLARELRLTAAFLKAGLPVIGVEAGAILLAVAAGGGADDAPLRLAVGEATRAEPDALGGTMPESFPFATYMRDRPVLPDGAVTLARDGAGEAVVFAVGPGAIGFVGHPGIKSAMVEDVIMEFDETPDDTAERLADLRAAQAGIAEALTALMVGIVAEAGWMSTDRD